jgi:guanyl-specific ribonuclease Sa
MALGALALVLLWRIIQVNAILYEDTGRPRLDLQAPSQERGAEHAALRAVIRDNPGEVAAMLMLARSLESEGKGVDAARAFGSALALAPLDKDVLALSAGFFLRRDDPRGIEILGLLAAQHPAFRDRAFAALLEVIASGRQRPAVAALIARDPPWLGAFIADSCARGVDPAVIMPVLLRKSANGIALAQAACAIDRLRAAGRWDQAYQLWLSSLPRERLSQVGYVFNGGFEHAVSGIGFDWILQPRPERETGHVAETVQTQGASGKRALRVAFNGKRQSGVPAQQYLSLPPGTYELSGIARPQGIVAPRGIHWTMRCANAPAARPIAASERFVGSSEWRPFALLQLEPAVEEGAAAFVGGIAWFDDLRIRRR